MLTVSRIAPIKRFDRIDKIATILENKQVDYKWFIVGKVKESEYSDYAKNIKEKLNKHKGIVFEGEKENPFNYMRSCDYTMILSDRETWSLVTTESKVVGTPCVITDFKAAYEQIEDGYNGLILSRENEQMYEDKVEKMLRNKKIFKDNLKNFEYPVQEILLKWDEKFN